MKIFPKLILTVVAAHSSIVAAQEMEPRAYSRAPVGTQFVLVTYAHQTGDVLTDASLPLRDVKVKLHSSAVGYGRTLAVAGRQATLSLLVPYVKGTASGTVFENQLAVTRSGLGDLRARFSLNIVGSPALQAKEFAAYKARTVVGASLTVVAPTGQFDPARLVNIGSHRWAFKPEIGISKPLGRWTIESAGGTWLFTPNNNFFGGSRREQRPLLSMQGGVIYTIRRRMWASANATYYRGGQTVVDGRANDDRQGNSRIGATYSLPLNDRQSLKIAWAKGLTTRFGGSLNAIAVVWQYTWLK
ncbi:MAG TPA: transporter [Pyrinomonadaceae bacterium]|nr:transporter [Pyrinomonadaceae bacterium]